ncbi:BON domain-containing protein [Amnibacterium sp.]|uniref:BON domain-containing protein n=1 Tax=Amnibacterium sp. TaxID=1872496 RepID=UPI003F7BEBBB
MSSSQQVLEHVRISESDGIRTVRGVVPDTATWSRMRDRLVAGMPSAAIADLTELVGARPRRRAEAAEAVARAVQDALHLAGSDATVLVSCDGSVVTLVGRAADARDRAVAGRAAWSTPGVRLVQNWIRTDR